MAIGEAGARKPPAGAPDPNARLPTRRPPTRRRSLRRRDEPATAPTRLEFDVSVGRPATEPGVAALLDVRAVTREGDVVSGRVRSAASEEVTDVSIVFVWRAEDSDAVVASVIYAVERVRPGVDARFEVDLAGEDVPDGEPDATFLAP